MRRLKTFISITGILLLILSATSIYTALRSLSELRPVEDYEDQGILTFKPYAVYPVQVENTGSGRSRRMNPTRTVYMVYYRATDGSGYQWTDEVSSRDQGREVVEAGVAVKRRVLSIPENRTYITVEPEQTAGSYTEGLRKRYTGIMTIGTLYIMFYVIVLLLVKLVRRLRQDRTEDTEAARFGLEAPEPKSRRWGWVALLILLLVLLLLIAFWSIGHRAGDTVPPTDGWSEDGGNTPVNKYVPPVNEEGYCVFDLPPSLLGNKTPEELVEEWQEALENVTPEDMDRLAWTELRANEAGGVSYFCTPEQYQRMKQSYYSYGTQIFPAMFGIDPGEIIKRISYAEIDGNGIPWGVDVWIDQAAFADAASFSDFIANFVPMTMIGRYQIMCGVPADEWAVHVTLKDVETDEVLFEKNYSYDGSAVSDSEYETDFPGSYTVPNGWVKLEKYSTKDKLFYVEEGHEGDELPDNISVEIGTNRYSADEHEKFRDAIVRQLTMQIQGLDAELMGSGTFTAREDVLYIFTIREKDAVIRQFYIVGDQRYCLIHMTNYTGSEPVNDAARAMADSFAWN